MQVDVQKFQTYSNLEKASLLLSDDMLINQESCLNKILPSDHMSDL